MQTLSQQLCERCLEPCEANPAAGRVALCDLKNGQQGRVMGFAGDPTEIVSRRLFDLGLAAGVEVEMIRRAPLRDPLMFRVAGSELVLRKRDAKRIVVQVA